MEAVPTRAAYGGRSQRARLVYLLGCMHVASMCKCTQKIHNKLAFPYFKYP